MYPTTVILLVETQRSMMDICEISPSNASKLAAPVASDARPPTAGHLSFAVGRPGPVHSTTDDEAQAQLSRAFQSQGGLEHVWRESFSKRRGIKSVLVVD